jgi:Bacterial Ig-like domain/LVIVD repeat
MNGQPMTTGQVGISTVPPQLVMDMLPPGVMQHTFDITIQAPGVATFATPATLTFPNVFNAAPGTKLDVLSFDHTTGRLVIDGTATVSADGLTVTTDPGSGVTAPGWHGLTPPGTEASAGPGNPCDSSTAGLIEPGLEAAAKIGAQSVLNINGIQDAAENAAKSLGIPEEDGFGHIFPARLAKVLDIPDLIIAFNTAFRDQTVTDTQRLIAAAKIGFYFIPAGRLKTLGKVGTVIAELVNGIAEANEEAEEIEAATAEDPCDPKNRPGVDDAASAIDQAIHDIDERAADHVAALQIISDLGAQIDAVLEHLDPSQPNLGLTPNQQTEVANDFEEFVSDVNQFDTDGPIWGPYLSIIQNLPIFVGGYTDTPAPSAPSGPTSQAPLMFWAVQYGETTLRGSTNSFSQFQVTIPPDVLATVYIYDPATDRIGETIALSGVSGTKVDLGLIPLLPDRGPDSDGDGLSDEAEFVIGTDPDKGSTTGDGISDLAKVQQGLNPLGAKAVSTGVVASLPLKGQAESVTLVGSSLAPEGQTAYVATGTYGLAIVAATNFQKPTLLSQLALKGNSTDVAVDPNLGIAVVASSDGGLHFIDVTNPASPRLITSVDVESGSIQAESGVAYAAVGGQIESFDMLTGNALSTLSLGGGTITGLTKDGAFLYSIDVNDTVRAIDISGTPMVARGSVTLPAGGGRLFAGGGVVYAAVTPFIPGGSTSFVSGYGTVDVSDPDHPRLLGTVGTFTSAGQAVAVNGSGLALTVGADGFGGPGALDVFYDRDPSSTTQFVTRFALPAPPVDVVIGSGIGFVADGEGGLQVVNYEPFDANGLAPSVSISFGSSPNVTLTDTGFQASEGATVPIETNIAEDVQVRNVELLVNGQVVSNRVSFPFDLTTELPSLAALNGQDHVTIQLRAIDTGGNVGLSNVLTIALIRDTTPPAVVLIDPADGSSVTPGSRVVRILFSEPISAGSITANNFLLSDVGGNMFTPSNIQTRADDRLVQLTYDTLPVGTLRLAINEAAITDRAGNPLGSGTLVSHFNVDRPSYLEYGDEDLFAFGYGSGVDPKAGATLTGLAAGHVSVATQPFIHGFPFSADEDDFPGTDQIYVGSSDTGSGHDGYAAYDGRLTGPDTLSLDYGALVPPGRTIDTLTLGIAADDFQRPAFGQPFVAMVNGQVNTTLTNALNQLNLTGPLTQFLTVGIDPSTLLPSDVLTVSIDEGGDGGDGYAVDFLTIAVTTSAH